MRLATASCPRPSVFPAAYADACALAGVDDGAGGLEDGVFVGRIDHVLTLLLQHLVGLNQHLVHLCRAHAGRTEGLRGQGEGDVVVPHGCGTPA